MRKVILFVAASLDGFIAGPQGQIDWLFTDQDYGYAEFLAGIDTLLIGRKTYELMLTFDSWPYPDLKCYVFTHQPDRWDDPRVVFTAGPVDELVRDLRSGADKNIWLVGGGELVRDFMNAGLVDELILGLHPSVMGAGVPLFPPGTKRADLRLMEARPYESGMLMVRYALGRRRRGPRAAAPKTT